MMWIAVVGIVLFIIGSGLDYYTSSQQPFYGVLESNPLNRDKYGYFSAKKFFIVHLIYSLVFIVPFVLTGEPLFCAGLIIAGALSVYQAWRNNHLAKISRRRDQIPVLKRLQQVGTYDIGAIRDAVGTLTMQVLSGRGRYVDFGWLYMDGLDQSPQSVLRLSDAVYPLLWQISRKPESEWFANLRMMKLN